MRKREQMAPVVCVTGLSGSGKTTLIVALIHELRGRGVRVATLKHASHGFSMDRPGKDTWRMKAAGAPGVAVVGGGRVALIADAGALGAGGPEPDPVPLAARLFSGVDLVLAEGFSLSAARRIEVIADPAARRPQGPGRILAVVDRSLPSSRTADLSGPEKPPVFSAADTAALAEFLLEALGIGRRSAAKDVAATATTAPGAGQPARETPAAESI